ncbi:transposable element Tc3 transposase [Trichonephila clavipes]|nr:transposable element Tc3 transposase [Trichonephila clavipes]
MYYSIDMNFFYSKDNLVALHFKYDQARRRFVEWAQNEIAVVPDFHKRILFRDEAHFWLNGNVNKQNCRIWSEANPQVYVETPLHPETLTFWCALWAGGIIGPYFFKNDEGHNVTVNGDRYRAMITNFFIPELNNHDVQELWFQQDDATCHTARATIDLLEDTFGDRLISRFGPVNWSPRSCDLTPLDYFLWGYVKSLVYADMPQTLDHLEDNIRRVIADIRPQMLEKVIENWTSRLDNIQASRGSHMPEIIFKIYPPGGATAYQLLYRSINHQVANRVAKNDANILALNRRFLSGVWTVNSPQSHIVRVYDAGHGKSGVFHSAEWHDGDWSSDGIREAWLWFFIWVFINGCHQG